MSCLLFSLTLILLTDASLTTSPSPQVVLDSDCPSCVLMKTNWTRSSLSDQSHLVEIVKQHILNMLNLNARPNLTRPVPRAALLNAVRKLRTGHLTGDQDQSRAAAVTEPAGPQTEIISFAEPGGSEDTVIFDLWQNGSATVEMAKVWIFMKTNKGKRLKAKVMLQLLWHFLREDEEEAVHQETVDTRRDGWHTVTVTHVLQTLLDAGARSVRLRVSCLLCTEAGISPILMPTGEHEIRSEDAHRPFLMVALQDHGAEEQRRMRRGLECGGKIQMCCKRHFYVNFREIGWNDWIIAPSGYHANFCEGDCPIQLTGHSQSSLSFHTAIINHYRLGGVGPFENVRSCCVPTRFRALSMLYYDKEQKIIKKDIRNMMVDECGCS